MTQMPRMRPVPRRGLALIAFANAGFSVFAQLSGVLVSILLTPFVLRGLGRDLYGVAVAAGSVYDYLSLLRGGLSAAVQRFVTLHHHAGRHAEAERVFAVGSSWAWLLRLGILVIGLALANPLCRLLGLSPELIRDGTIGVALIITATVVADATSMISVPIYATGETHRLAQIRVAATWGRLALVALTFTVFVPSLASYGGSVLLLEILPIPLLLWLANRAGVVRSATPRPDFGDRAVRRELFQYGGFATVAELAGVIYISTNNLIIGRLYGAAVVTHYSLGTRWAPLVRGFLIQSIQSLTPIFTQLEARGESARGLEALNRVVAVTSTLAVPFCLVPCVVGDLFLSHWVGPEYADSSRYLIAVLAPTTVEVALAPVWMALIARGQIKWIAGGDVTVAIGNVVLGLVLAIGLGLGPLGFALGGGIALLVRDLLLRPLAARWDGGLPRGRLLFAPLGKSLVGGAPALAALYVLRGAYDASLGAVLVAGCVGGILCLSGSALAAIGPTELRSIWQLILSRSRSVVA